MVTQMDVARLAGVGRRTVSNVVIGFPHVSEEARARVLRAIDELGYVPNRAAQRLRTGRSGVIALTVPEVGVGYFGELANLIIEEAALRGLGTIIAQTHGSRERELTEIERLLALQPDGLVASPLGLTLDDIETFSARTSVALIGEHFLDETVSTIAIDNSRAAAEITTHLIDSGSRRIAFIGGPADAEHQPHFNELRRSGCLSVLAAHDLDPVIDVCLEDYTAEAGFRAGITLAERDVDAVFCVTDEVAIGVIRALHDAGRRVPDDIRVAGFDDIPEGRFSTPRLTTASPDKIEIARRAVAATLGEQASTDPVPHTLIVRESTSRPAASSTPRPRA